MGITDKLKTVFITEEELENVEEEKTDFSNRNTNTNNVSQNSESSYDKVEQSYNDNRVEQPAPRQSSSIENEFSSEFNGKDAGVILLEPKTFTESREIGEFIKTNNAVCLNLSSIDQAEARRIIDFVSGVIFSLDGKIKKIANGVFLCAPSNIGVAGKISNNDAVNAENIKKW